MTEWLEIAQYEDKRAISIANLVQTTWLYRYPTPIEITYDQGKEFIAHEFRKYLTQMEYMRTAKPSTLVNPMFNVLSERIHQVLGNLVRNVNVFTHTYIDKNDPRTGILAAAVFAICSTNSGRRL